MHAIGLLVLHIGLPIAHYTEPRRTISGWFLFVATTFINGYWGLVMDLSTPKAEDES